MSPTDWQLVASAVSGIALSILLIVKGRLHPFMALLCGAFAIGLMTGHSLSGSADRIQEGAGDILGGTGLIVALGLILGTFVDISRAGSVLAAAMMRRVGLHGAPWATLAVALIIGLPLFFETGVVLLLPIVASVAARFASEDDEGNTRLRLMLSAVAGLSVVHALVPPHPGPLLAIGALHADLARTLLYGLIVAVPVAILSGPVLASRIGEGIRLAPAAHPADNEVVPPSLVRAAFVMLLPVALIAAGQLKPFLPPSLTFLSGASNPVAAMLIACLAAIPLLLGARVRDPSMLDRIWREAMAPAGAILLSIGAGGALKQVLVSAGLADLLARVAVNGSISPLLLVWTIAVVIRLATGSATVATITTAGIAPALIAKSGASAELAVLAIGAGSVFFSHVNDPGFWLVKSYLGTSTRDTFRTWSVLETTVSVLGIAIVLALNRLGLG